MSDPLSLLRDHTINKKPVSHDDTHIIMGGLRFMRTTLTAYKQDRGRGDPYPLEALYFLLQKPHLAGAAKTRAYNEECKKAGFARVLLADQKDVLAYLTGKTETSQYLVSIDELANISVPAAPEAEKVKASDKVGEKRPREEAPKLDLSDEGMLAAKKDIGGRIDEKIAKLSTVEKGIEAKQIATVENLEANTSVYLKADAPLTKSLLEKERTSSNRVTCLHTKSGREFSHLISLMKSATQPDPSGGHGSKTAENSNPAQPARRDRYNVEAKDAYKAAGMDSLFMEAEAQGSLLSANTAGNKAQNGEASDSKSRGPGQPIILVPQAQSSMVNILNVKELLEKGEFKTREQKVAEKAKKEERVTIAHQEDGHTHHYKVVENPQHMKKEDWSRVVAVFVQGKEWQFKQYDLSFFNKCLQGFFTRTSAFYLSYAKEPVPENIKAWNVAVLTVDRNHRHLDSRVMNQFWDTLKVTKRLASQIRAKGRT